MLRKITKWAILGFVCSSFFAALAGPARADHTWNVSSGIWAFGGNWNPIGAPLSTDNAFVGSGTANVGFAGAVCNFLDIGLSSPGTVTITPSGGLTAFEEQTGAYFSDGYITQTGGTNNATNSLHVGDGFSGFYNLSGSGLLTTPTEIVGFNVGEGSSFTQSAGTNAVGAGGLYADINSGYTMNGPGLLTSAGPEIIGYTNGYSGNFTQSAGTNNAPNLFVGYNAAATGSYGLSGSGQLSVTGSEYVGYSGGGTLTQSGGTHNTANLFLGYSSGANGAYYLNGGTLACLQVSGGSGVGTLNLNGGVLQATANSNNFIGGLTAANVLSGGAYVDSNGQSITIAQRLLNGGGGGGLTKSGAGLLIVTGSNTYTGVTTVNGGSLQVGNGGASGNISANAVVNANGTLVFDFAGNYSLTTNVSGSGTLVQAGPGTLLLGGPASFSIGALVVNAGSGLNQSAAASANGVTNNGLYTINAATLSLAGGILSNYSTVSVTSGGNIAGNVFNSYGASLNINAATIGGDVGNYGTMTQSGLVNVQGTLTNAGVVTVSAGGALGGGALNNSFGGSVRGDGAVSMTIVNQGLIDASGGAGLTLTHFTGGNAPSGVLNVENGDTLQVFAGGSVANQGTINLAGPGSLLSGDPIANTGTIEGQGRIFSTVQNTGVISPLGGQLTLSATDNANSYGGTIQTAAGTSILFAQGLRGNYGLIALTGGMFNNGNNPLANYGSILGNGTFSSGTLTNYNVVTISDGNSSILGAVQNTSGGTITTIGTASSDVVFFGPVSGPGYFKVTGATTRFLGGFNLNGGTLNNDPAAVYVTGFSISTGGLVQGVAGDQFFVTAPFNNAGRINLGGTSQMVVNNGTGLLTQTAGQLDLGTSATLSAGTVAVDGGTLLGDGPGALITSSLIYDSSSPSTYQGVLAGGGNTLTVNNPNALFVLSGMANSYAGGTFVTAGELVVTSASGVASGTNLSIGSGIAIFGAPVVPQTNAAPVPEPDTLVLLLAAAAVGLVMSLRLNLTSRRVSSGNHSCGTRVVDPSLG